MDYDAILSLIFYNSDTTEHKEVPCMGFNVIQKLCANNNQKAAAGKLYGEGWDGANEGATIADLMYQYDLTQEDAEEIFSEIIRLEEQDGIYRDEFGNEVDPDSDFIEE